MYTLKRFMIGFVLGLVLAAILSTVVIMIFFSIRAIL